MYREDGQNPTPQNFIEDIILYGQNPTHKFSSVDKTPHVKIIEMKEILINMKSHLSICSSKASTDYL